VTIREQFETCVLTLAGGGSKLLTLAEPLSLSVRKSYLLTRYWLYWASDYDDKLSMTIDGYQV